MVGFVNRGRDVAMLIDQDGERGMRKAIVKLAEDNEMLRQELQQTQDIMTRMIDQLASLSAINMGLKDKFEDMMVKFYPDNEANPNKKWSR
jgi:hypothetical protein